MRELSVTYDLIVHDQQREIVKSMVSCREYSGKQTLAIANQLLAIRWSPASPGEPMREYKREVSATGSSSVEK